MALGLVGRSVYALSEHLNKYYRVFKGTDPDNVYVRLPTAGSFEIRHSVTNAPIVRVTDAGLVAPIDGALVTDGTISSAELKDDTIMNVDVNSAAAIAVSKLANMGTGNVLKGGATANAPGQIGDGDVASGANIAVTKLAHVGANNVLKSTGTANVGGQVVNGDVAAGAAIAYSKLNLATSIVNADVAAAAAIAVTKVADVGANNVLRSNGAGNVAGKIVTNDMVINTINADRLLDASITASKLGTGITAPACALIQSFTVTGSPQLTITFSSIPQSYASLEIRILGRSSAAVAFDAVTLLVNGSNPASYMNERFWGSGATTVAGEGVLQTYADVGWVTGASAVAAWMGSVTIRIHGYSTAGVFKTIHAVGHAAWGTATTNHFVYSKGSTYGGDSLAVTSLLLGVAGGSWAVGSIVGLYGYI